MFFESRVDFGLAGSAVWISVSARSKGTAAAF